MFSLIPYKHLAITTNLSIKDSAILIADNISAPPTSLFRRSSGSGFEGSVSRDGFTINRIIHYRNSFLPVLNGRFSPHKRGTKIEIYITLHPIILILSPIFFYPFFEMVVMVIKDFLLTGNINANNLDPMGTGTGFLYLVGIIAFGFEAKKVETFVKMVYEKHEQLPKSEKTTQQSAARIAYAISGLAFIAGLIISWLSFGR
jgi:hypothetical protein